MQYSKKITDFCKTYGLIPEDVFYCMLVACGAGRGEAFATIYKPKSPNLVAHQKAASTLANDKPGINQLIAVLQFKTSPEVNRLLQPTKRIAKVPKVAGKENVLQFRDKLAIVEALEQTVPILVGKEKADVLMKIADLQQLKKDENKDEIKTVHYYLPLKCTQCELYQKRKSGEI